MNHGEDGRPKPGSYRAASGADGALLQEVLQKLQSATAIINLIIDDELTGPRDPGTLDRLYAANREVARAMEEAMRRLSLSGSERRQLES